MARSSSFPLVSCPLPICVPPPVLSQALCAVYHHDASLPLLSLCRSMLTRLNLDPFSYHNYLRLGLPFSDKKIIPRNTEQDGTDGREEEKNLGIPFRTISRKNKPSEVRSEPFLGREKPSEFHSEQFLDEKILGIPFRIIFGRVKNLWKDNFC